MKKLIYILLFASLSASAQTIDTTFHNSRACKLVPFKNNPRTDTVNNVTHLIIMNGNIDFTHKVINIGYALTGDIELNTPVLTANYNISGADFVTVLNALSIAPVKILYFFQYLGTKLSVTYQ